MKIMFRVKHSQIMEMQMKLRFVNLFGQDNSTIVRHGNVEYHPKYAIASIEDVFAFLEREYIVHYKTK